jgi:hypothetical protein
LSARSETRRRSALVDFLVRVAIDPRAMGAFLGDPRGAAIEAGLTRADRAILLSGDQNRLYAALAADRPRPRATRRKPGR